MSAGDSLLLAFPELPSAIRCAVALAEVMTVTKPIATPLGPLRTRMAIHASQGFDGPPPTVDTLFRTAAQIASKAREGEILISGSAHALVPDSLENLEFKLRHEQLELGILKRVPQLEDLYEVLGITKISLNQRERGYLLEQDPKSKGGGGFQAFLVGLQERLDRTTGCLALTIQDRERIARYAHDYKGGGWQGRLRKIFGKTLGPNLGREIS